MLLILTVIWLGYLFFGTGEFLDLDIAPLQSRIDLIGFGRYRPGLSSITVGGRWQVRGDPRVECRRGRDGVERRGRMGG